MPIEINNETYYTANEACDFLGITRDTLYRRIREGRLLKYTHGAKNRVYFRLTDLNVLKELHPAQGRLIRKMNPTAVNKIPHKIEVDDS